ncbi:MAG: M48 family metalloprotease [Actinomycetota bacterium]
MTSSGPTILALETDSAWVVILAVSLVTIVASFLMRRLVARPGGLFSGLLLLLPLVLPIVAALAYEHAVLPEVSVLRQLDAAISDRSSSLLHLLMVGDAESHTVAIYGMSGSAGPWILLIGASVTSFMLIRRALGTVMVSRLIGRCVPLCPEQEHVRHAAIRLAREAGLRYEPAVLLLPAGVSGAFAVGMRRGKVLLSQDLIDVLEESELHGIIAHEIAHLEARDVSIVFTGGLLRDLVAWNPFAHLALRRLAMDREFEADRRAAALTGQPLAVASGLLKLFELFSKRRSLGQRAALAFWRPGSNLSRRVDNLIAVADGRTSVASAGGLPFVLAGLLVAVLGLQVGQRIANDDAGALAIFWGSPVTSSSDVWEAPKRISRHHGGSTGRHSVGAQRRPGGYDGVRPIRYPEFSGTVLVREGDIDNWLTAVEASMAKGGVSLITIKWESRQDWQAVPIMSSLDTGPLGFYRIEQQS